MCSGARTNNNTTLIEQRVYFNTPVVPGKLLI